MLAGVKKCVDSNDMIGLRYIFADSLDVDPTFGAYKEDYDYCRFIEGFFEFHVEMTTFRSQSGWDMDYWIQLKIDLSNNFSEERFTHMIEAAKVVYAEKVERLQKERNEAAQMTAMAAVTSAPSILPFSTSAVSKTPGLDHLKKLGGGCGGSNRGGSNSRGGSSSSNSPVTSQQPQLVKFFTILQINGIIHDSKYELSSDRKQMRVIDHNYIPAIRLCDIVINKSEIDAIENKGLRWSSCGTRVSNGKYIIMTQIDNKGIPNGIYKIILKNDCKVVEHIFTDDTVNPIHIGSWVYYKRRLSSL